MTCLPQLGIEPRFLLPQGGNVIGVSSSSQIPRLYLTFVKLVYLLFLCYSRNDKGDLTGRREPCQAPLRTHPWPLGRCTPIEPCLILTFCFRRHSVLCIVCPCAVMIQRTIPHVATEVKTPPCTSAHLSEQCLLPLNLLGTNPFGIK